VSRRTTWKRICFDRVSQDVAERNPDAVVIVPPPRADALARAVSEQRGGYLPKIAARDHMA
jgi:hypothetical protein